MKGIFFCILEYLYSLQEGGWKTLTKYCLLIIFSIWYLIPPSLPTPVEYCVLLLDPLLPIFYLLFLIHLHLPVPLLLLVPLLPLVPLLYLVNLLPPSLPTLTFIALDGSNCPSCSHKTLLKIRTNDDIFKRF